MDNLENKTPIQPGPNDLQAQYNALQHLVVSVLILVIMISGTLTIFLLRQWVWAKRDLAAIRPQATQMIADYQKVNAPVMTDFVEKLKKYGQTHPDFAPVLTKYNLKPAAPTTAAPARLTPPPPAPATPKK